MKRFLGFILLLLSSPASARDLAVIQKSKTLVAATIGTFAPFSYFKNGKLTGFEVDLLQALAQKMGLKVEWKTVPFDVTLIGLDHERYDLVIASHGITEERARSVDFTDPYYCSGAIVMSLVGGPKTRADLRGKTLGAQVGTTYLPYLEKIPQHGEIKIYKSDSDLLLALIGKRVDAMIGDRFAALATIKARPEDHLQAGDLLFEERIAMAVRKGNTGLHQAVNEALARLMKDGTYAAISQRYFGEDIRCRR